ncbi:MAG: lipopolysaccharide transporter periplasmic protein LptA [Deltaproteobacteria bacterium]|nr:lipopolysaccharide transporter periplasmic protein LptA [Deltaproteobacteria bacterium]
MRRMRIRWALALLLVALTARGAQGQERKGLPAQEAGARPIEVTADRLNADSGKDTVTFEGNVIARQGDVTMHSNRLHAEYSRRTKTIERIEAEGAVRFLQEGREARSDRATFFNLEQRVVFSGGAVLKQGENTLKGETITIFLQENRAVVTGAEGGGRVEAVINPKGIREAPKP